MKVLRKILYVFLLLGLLFNTQAAEARVHLFRDLALGTAVVGAVLYTHYHDANGNLKPGCNLRKKPKDSQDDLGDYSGSDGQDSGGYQAEQSASDRGLLEKSNAGARKLRANLNLVRKNSGMPPIPPDCEAHHIVPETDSGEFSKDARDVLAGCVDINSARNGIFLPGPKNPTSKKCESKIYHRTIHKDESYYKPLALRLMQAREYGGCKEVIKELDVVKNDLINGKLP